MTGFAPTLLKRYSDIVITVPNLIPMRPGVAPDKFVRFSWEIVMLDDLGVTG